MDASAPHLQPHNLAFIEQLYACFLQQPDSVEPEWRAYFERLAASDGDLRAAQTAVDGPSFRPPSIFNPPAASVGSPAISVGDLPRLPAPVLDRRLRFLSELRLFRGLPDEELALIARLGHEESHADGTVLFREGQPGHSLYLIAAGNVVVRRKKHVLATLSSGDVVGEMSVLDRQPRSADAIAHGELEVLRIEGRDLLALTERRPVLTRGLVALLSRRLRERSSRQDMVNRLIHAYRVRGHLLAKLDPLGSVADAAEFPELSLEYYGLSERDLDALFSSTTISGTTLLTLREILKLLRVTYSDAIGVQFMHIDNHRKKEWLLTRLEDSAHHRLLNRDEKLNILTKLTDAEIFEQFLHRKFLGAKRFSLEGAETLIPLLDLAIDEAGGQGIREVVIGMAHRGRLNVLVNIMGKSPRDVFQEFADDRPENKLGRGDVKYHLGYSNDRISSSGQLQHLSLCFNPSHLEFVNPVLVGRVRAKQDRYQDREHRHALGILIHGDAAFAGQGVGQELFNLSDLQGYRTGGTLHIVVNNQIGFTTSPSSARSTHYATEVARMLQTPIFHVNGENPEAVAQVVRLAMDYRQEFRKDVVIDMYCYRRHGHNEGDEPSYTQPLMYDKIRRRKSVREGYLDSLLQPGGITREEADEIITRRTADLEKALSEARAQTYELRGPNSGEGLWRPYRGGADAAVPRVATKIPKKRLVALLRQLCEVPEGFALNRKLKRFIANRLKMAAGDQGLDWGTAEMLAFASLLLEGAPVRLSGQDSGRGTFSHRHAVFRSTEDGSDYIPLQHLAADQAQFRVWDSPLSEIAVLGFEYGYSLDTPDGLNLWEAQFGDFCNVAQVIIDQFITSSEEKWRRLSALVMLLPHGFEGQGPEHSSARLERFLSLAAEDNIQVVNLTTPAQYFHCLRRQVVRPLRKPLVVMSPKSLLRHPQAVSSLADLSKGKFHRVIGDVTGIDPSKVRRVLLTSGKVYYELEAARHERGCEDIAILRLEQYYPLDLADIEQALGPYADGTPLVWVQEEPWNMGAWFFLRLHLQDDLCRRWPLSCVSRPESASPATGSAAAHKIEQQQLIDQAFGED